MAALVAMTAQFFRNAHVVVAPDIMRELDASAASLAALTSAMFLAAAFTQIPGGILLDRFGTRATMPIMLVLSGIGAGLFGAAHSVGGLVFARAFMGVGGAVLVMAGIVACVRWFDARHFSTIAGGIMATSQLGNLVSTVPMALIASWFGWRGAYVALLVATLLLAALVYALVRDAPPGHDFHARPRETLRQSAAGVMEVLRIPGIWRLMVMAWFAWGTTSCIIGLWAGPYLSDVHGLDTLGRGKALFWMAIGVIAGALGSTLLDRWTARTKRTIVLGATASSVVFAVLALWPRPGLTTATLLLTLLGLIGGYSVLIATHGRQFYPDRLIGRGISTVNCAVLFGAASLQVLTGVIVQTLSTPGAPIGESAYRAMFGALSIALVIALACYRRCPEKAATSA
ncbi:MAG: MFS transporter [Betaproteobacteria bacterium]|nr:MFS transporter [Betaproteobacteria bacterium]